MTLLEAFVSLIILGISAVGWLDVFQSGARSLTQAGEWQRTVAIAEAAMESALLGDALQSQVAISGADETFTRRVEVVARGSGLAEIVVTVESPRGVTFSLSRLVDRR
ncbi:MAG: hypothetical protein ACT4OZ_14585 [Gemmatimonadota bacterium]